MGACASSRVELGYSELRDSIPGSLVAEQDFDLFYSLCKVESTRSLSSILIPSQCPLFYVVVSGELHVHVSSAEMKNKSMVATTFTIGEMIHFFNATLRTTHFPGVNTFDGGEILRDNGVKLTLHLKSLSNTTARVIGMDRSALEEFKLLAKHSTHSLSAFLGLSMAEMTYASPYLKTATQEQAAMFGILMKVRLSHIGGVISPVENDAMSGQTDSIGNKSPSERVKRNLRASQSYDARCCTAVGPVSFIFSGTALVVPYGAPLNPQMQKLQQAHNAAVPKSSHSPKAYRTNTASSLLSLNTFAAGHHRKPTDVPAIFSEALGRAQLDKDRDTDAYLRQHLLLTTGMMLGLGGTFCREPQMPPLSVVASSPSVIGYLSYETVDALFAADPCFRRVLQRNFFMQVLSWFKPTVPLLRDMDTWSFTLLSSKVSLKCFESNSVVYTCGSRSDFAYIIVSGAIKKTIDTSALRSSPVPAKDGTNVKVERILNTGTLFGEVALASNSPYFSTVVTQEPTMLFCISKHVLEQIYNNNKAKLCEIRIRLLGGDAALQHVVDHPRGCQLFQTYLDKELAGENLRFYSAVDRFDAMCRDLVRQHRHLTKACARYKRELSNAYDLMDSSAASGKDEIDSYEGSGKNVENEDKNIDLEADGNFDAPSTFSSTANTASATRQTSFFSDGGDVTVCEEATDPALQTGLITPTGSRNNSIDSDVFIQYTAQANHSNGAALSEQPSSPFKPVLESIISESNLPFHDDSKKFSVKFKPIPQISVQTNQVLPLSEKELGDDLESDGSNQPVIKVVATHPATSYATAVSERAADLEEAREVARSLMQKLHRIQRNIVELKHVAQSIMQAFIYDGSEYQLNLPGAVRSRTEEKFKDWVARLFASVTRDAQAQSREQGGFHSLQLSRDRKNSFDLNYGTDEHDLNYGASTRTGGLSNRSDSFEFTPTSNINADFTPSSVNYSADDYLHGPNISANVIISSTTAVAAGAGAGATSDAEGRKLGSLTSGFEASIPFPSHGILIEESGADGPLPVRQNNAYQAHESGNYRTTKVPAGANHLIAVQVQSLDLTFVNLFTESKQEILKLLRDDKFPRFKLTPEFQQFIHAIKPYGSSALSGGNVTSFHSLENP